MGMLSRSKLTRMLIAVVTMIVLALPLTVSSFQSPLAHATSASSSHAYIDCTKRTTCVDVYDSEKVFGEGVYVGHDEPATLFYSNVPGSGNRMSYELTLPSDPSSSNPLTPGKAYNFELHVAFWFGMAMCDTQSYPELLSTCTPDSDTNIVDPAISPNHPGEAFMEMQFYPPGWASWPNVTGCSATQWCAALNIDSLSANPVTGKTLNPTCAAITGLEYVNFAFITKNGVPQPNSPPNPVQSTINTLTPNPAYDLFMNSGDKLDVTMHDTAHGLKVVINDDTTGQSGSMTASAANGFGQVQFAPSPSKACNNIPYDFHPMYSTSSEMTRVTWAAHSYNIAFSDEIGHFDFCNGKPVPFVFFFGAPCPRGNTEGIPGDQEPTDNDDLACFPASASALIQVSGCAAANTGFDGSSYQPVWPDGNYKLHPTPIRFSSPLTGDDYNVQYNRFAFEADLPGIESAAFSGGPCDPATGVRCTLIPETDDGQPAAFYPFFSIANFQGNCVWQFGNHIPGSKNDFHQNQQYGTLLNLSYTGAGGMPFTTYNDFRQVFSSNPCPE